MLLPTCQDGSPLNPKQVQFIGFYDDGKGNVSVIADLGRNAKRIWNFEYTPTKWTIEELERVKRGGPWPTKDGGRSKASDQAVSTVISLNEILRRTPRSLSWAGYKIRQAEEGREVPEVR